MRFSLDIGALRRLLRYDPDTGLLYWLPRTPDLVRPGRNGAVVEAERYNAKHAGNEAFTCIGKAGYRTGTINGRYVAAHRVAWALATGKWPDGDIDHINGVRSDNRLVNLRDVAPAENARNARLSVRNTSGRMGVYWRHDQNKWGANIRHAGKLRHLGFFDDFDSASARRSEAEREYGYHPNHGRSAA